MSKFGQPGDGSNSNFKKVMDIKEDTCFRILPPMMGYMDTGKWYNKVAIHYGYTKPGIKPGINIPLPFYCIEQVRWSDGVKHIVQHCPACDLLKIKKDEFDELTKKRQMGKLPPNAEQRYLELEVWTKANNLCRKVYMNIKFKDGKFSTIRIIGKLLKNLDEQMSKLKARTPSISALAADQGVWWEVTRSGQGFDTNYFPTPLTVPVDGVPGATMIKLAPLTDADANNAELQCFDLFNLPYHTLTGDQIQTLIDSDGDQAIVQAVFAAPERLNAMMMERKHAEQVVAKSIVPATVTEVVTQPSVFVPQLVQVSEPVSLPPVSPQQDPVQDEEAVLLAQLAALKAKKGKAQQSNQSVNSSPTTGNIIDNPASAEAFLASFNIK
jgi:hypothetical protein